MDLRVGNGFDVHPFREGRPLVIGGEKISFRLGLDGHSDADVLLHALTDALLGAASLGDIGRHFPDSDPANRNRSSLEMLGAVAALLADMGFRVLNVDATVIAEMPKLSPLSDAMRANIARCLGIDKDRVGLKATTTEGLGFTGRGEGIAALATCLISRDGREGSSR